MDKVLENEIRKTYADCQYRDATYEMTKDIRRLDWKAETPVSGDDVREALLAACKDGYNEFDPINVSDAILTVDPKARVFVAREGSVCLYIVTHRPIEMQNALRHKGADEIDRQPNGSIRFWWD